MKRPFRTALHQVAVSLGLLVLLGASGRLFGEAPPATANAAFDTYSRSIEARLATQHQAAQTFLSPWPPAATARMLAGDPVLEPLSPSAANMPAGALLHHWRATVFVPQARAADFERLLRNIAAYPRIFTPDVLAARTLADTPTSLQASLRVRQHHVLTVVLDTTYDIAFGSLDPAHGFSLSRSVHVAEIAAPGTPAEHPLTPAEEHGFLWRQNTYWSWAQSPAASSPGPSSGTSLGLILQVESVSLTRAVPAGLGWAVRPYVESIPRESLAFTLRAAANALLQQQHSERITR